MYTKNAFKNLKNRYKAVLKKCNLLNTFGSLALASAFLMSSTVMPHSACASTVQETDAYLIQEYVSGTSYYNTFNVQESDANGTITTTQYGILLKTPTATAGMTGTASTMKDLLTAYIVTETSDGTSNPFSSITVEESGTFSFNYTTDNNANTEKLFFNVYNGDTSVTNTGNRVTDPTLTTNLNSNFIALSSESAFGGAINNTSSNNIDITGDFIGNSTSNTSNLAQGGAIYNTGTLGDITGSFIGNYASGAGSGVNGGAIYNQNGTLGNISGNFIGNYASNTSNLAQGGAIYNDGAKAEITSITGSFIGNYVSGSGSYGGAIYNQNGTLGNISGNFIGNYASGPGASGGAIYNDNGTIDDIRGSFIGNYASGSGASQDQMRL